MTIKAQVKLSIVAGESCDHCGEITADSVYVFKFRMPDGWAQLWLHKKCLATLTEKLWMMEARLKRKEDAATEGGPARA